MKTGRLLTRFSDRLARLDDPLFIFDLQFDLIVAPDEVAILNLTGFDRVFADLDPTGNEVPHHIADMKASLGTRLQAAAEARIEAVCRAKPGLARRLRRISRSHHLAA